MRFEEDFRKPSGIDRLLKRLETLSLDAGPIRIMEICGTHTMSIAKSGLRSLLPPSIRLVSGPGCPVCVTPAGYIDAILRLSERPGLVITSYGDLLRVPGSQRGDTLLRRRAEGAQIHMVYSPMEALEMAAEHPEREVVFLGVGFETTAPGTAACILEAAERGIRNFSVLCLLKNTPPALRALINAPDFAVNGFLCPGHVAAITGSDAFQFLPQEYGLPAVVSGFEAGDLLFSVYRLVDCIVHHTPALENEYTRLVQPKGNPAALAAMRQVFEPTDNLWRGLGLLPASGLRLR
uniref:hydrogenase formation protein HypD n=1 Tax=uncultured Ruthenibacterium sp. TaxID=1905347 RepID=UPI00349E99A5